MYVYVYIYTHTLQRGRNRRIWILRSVSSKKCNIVIFSFNITHRCHTSEGLSLIYLNGAAGQFCRML